MVAQTAWFGADGLQGSSRLRPATSPVSWQRMASAHDEVAALVAARAGWNEATNAELAQTRARVAARSCKAARCSSAQANAFQQVWEPLPRRGHGGGGDEAESVAASAPPSGSATGAARAPRTQLCSMRSDPPEESWASEPCARAVSACSAATAPADAPAACAQPSLLDCDSAESSAARVARVLVATQQAASLQHMGPNVRKLIGLYHGVWRTPGTLLPDERDWDARCALAHAGRVDGAESLPLYGQVVRSAADLRALLPELDQDRAPAFWQVTRARAPATNAVAEGSQGAVRDGRTLVVEASAQFRQSVPAHPAAEAHGDDWTTALASCEAAGALASFGELAPPLGMPRSEVLRALELEALGPRYAPPPREGRPHTSALDAAPSPCASSPEHSLGQHKDLPSYMQPLQRHAKAARAPDTVAELTWLDARQRALEMRRIQRRFGAPQCPGVLRGGAARVAGSAADLEMVSLCDPERSEARGCMVAHGPHDSAIDVLDPVSRGACPPVAVLLRRVHACRAHGSVGRSISDVALPMQASRVQRAGACSPPQTA